MGNAKTTSIKLKINFFMVRCLKITIIVACSNLTLILLIASKLILIITPYAQKASAPS
jgi:hypothetical protein